MSAREKGPREMVRIVALLINEADAYETVPISEALQDAIGSLMAFDPEVEILLLREHETEACQWMNLNDWRPTCLPRPELTEAYQEWVSGRVYVDRKGAYHYKYTVQRGERRTTSHGRPQKAPWSDRARRYHPSNESFREAARRWHVERDAEG